MQLDRGGVAQEVEEAEAQRPEPVVDEVREAEAELDRGEVAQEVEDVLVDEEAEAQRPEPAVDEVREVEDAAAYDYVWPHIAEEGELYDDVRFITAVSVNNACINTASTLMLLISLSICIY